MGDKRKYSLAFGDVTTKHSGHTNQIGVVNGDVNFYDARNERQSMLDEFGPVDPREEWARIFAQKGDVLDNSCSWVFDDEAYKSWFNGDDSDANIMWIHGHPGKGKTMIFKAVVEHISQRAEAEGALIGFFLCQRTDDRLNTACGILKGLIYSLISRDDYLLRQLHQKYHARQKTSETDNFWTLWTTLKEILTSSTAVYLAIDALDECSSQMLDLLNQIVSCRLKVRWMITSRNNPEIREVLENIPYGVHTSLELNSMHVNRAVQQFTKDRVSSLSQLKTYGSVLRSQVEEYMLAHSEDTFLWVSLVYEELRKVKRIHALSALWSFPSGLTPLYERMFQLVCTQENDGEAMLCQQILKTVSVLFRPLSLQGLGLLCKLPSEYIASSEDIKALIDQCGSFLVVDKDTVSFVHQSASDFFTKGFNSSLPYFDVSGEHRRVAGMLLHTQISALKKDICNVKVPGASWTEVAKDKIHSSIPSLLRYSIVFWIDHLLYSDSEDIADCVCQHKDIVDELLNKHLLHWFEALGWLQATSSGLLGLERLGLLLEEMQTDFAFQHLVQDAVKFLIAFRHIIEEAPTQVYASPLVFSPISSKIKIRYGREKPKWLVNEPLTDSDWTQSKRIFDVSPRRLASTDSNFGEDDDSVIEFSPSNDLVAIRSKDGCITLVDTATATTQRSLQDQTSMDKEPSGAMSFTQDGKQLVSLAVAQAEVRIWDIVTGSLLFHHAFRVQAHSPEKLSVSAVSPNGKFAVLAIAGGQDGYLRNILEREKQLSYEDRITDANLERPLLRSLVYQNKAKSLLGGMCLFNLDDFTSLRSIHSESESIFSPDSKLLLVLPKNESPSELIHISNPSRSFFLENRGYYKRQWLFSLNSQFLAYNGYSYQKILDTSNGEIIYESREEKHWHPVAISNKGNLLAYEHPEQHISVICISETPSYRRIRLLRGHTGLLRQIFFSSDDKILVSSASDNTVRFWDMQADFGSVDTVSDEPPILQKGRLTISPDRTLFASANSFIQVCSTLDGHELSRLTAEKFMDRCDMAKYLQISALSIDASGKNILFSYYRPTSTQRYRLDVSKYVEVLCISNIEHPSRYLQSIVTGRGFTEENQVRSVALSHDGQYVVFVRGNGKTGLCDLGTEVVTYLTSPIDYKSVHSSEIPLIAEAVSVSERSTEESYHRASAIVSIDKTRSWLIDAKGTRLLWLPSSYRPKPSSSEYPQLEGYAQREGMIAIRGGLSNRVTILKFDTELLSKGELL